MLAYILQQEEKKPRWINFYLILFCYHYKWHNKISVLQNIKQSLVFSETKLLFQNPNSSKKAMILEFIIKQINKLLINEQLKWWVLYSGRTKESASLSE